MKKTGTKTTEGTKKSSRSVRDPLDGPVDFERFGPVRRNAFAGADEPGGPSLSALWEMPEIDRATVLLRRGRPPKGAARATEVRSMRLPAETWRRVEAAARKKHLNLHQAMREAVLGWVRRAG